MAFIKLDRKLLNWEWFDDPNTLSVWIYLLLKASWEDNEYKGIKVPAGSLITGRYKIAKDTGLTDQQVRTALKHLKETKEISIKSTKESTKESPTNQPMSGSLITIEKWALYQGLRDSSTYKSTKVSTKESTTTKEYKEYKEIKNILLAPSAEEYSLGARYLMPLLSSKKDSIYRYWMITEEFIETLSETYPNVNVYQECKELCLYYETNPTKRKTAAGAKKTIVAWMARQQNKPENFARKEAPEFDANRISELLEQNNFGS